MANTHQTTRINRVVNLCGSVEFSNCCKNCGAIDTLWPVFRGRKRYYECDKCGSFKGGCKPSEFKGVD